MHVVLFDSPYCRRILEGMRALAEGLALLGKALWRASEVSPEFGATAELVLPPAPRPESDVLFEGRAGPIVTQLPPDGAASKPEQQPSSYG